MALGVQVFRPRGKRRTGRTFIDLMEPYHEKSPAASRLAMACVDDYLLYKAAAFMTINIYATAVLQIVIAR